MYNSKGGVPVNEIYLDELSPSSIGINGDL